MSCSSAKPADFDGEIAYLYSIISENHRHPCGPWTLMLDKVKALGIEGRSESVLIDIASGPGEPASTIALAMPSVTVFSTDVSVDMHKAAAKKSISVRNMKSMVVDAQDLSAFQSGSMDVVTCCYGFMFPNDKVKCLSEVHRILKPGGALVATYWLNLVQVEVCAEIMVAINSVQVPPIPFQSHAINPLSLSEPGLFESLAVQAGFDASRIESVDSSYPFDFGNHADSQYKMVTLPIKSQIDALDGQHVARQVYDDIISKYAVLDSATGSLILPNNTFIMATLVK